MKENSQFQPILRWKKLPELDIIIDEGTPWQVEHKNIVKQAYSQITLSKNLTILLSGDDVLQGLNHRFRKKDYPTNILSFSGDGEHLGDIAISYQRIEQEAVTQQKTFENHLTHIVIHGILHLLGYDHEQPDEQEIMESKEIEILAKMDISNPYE